MKDFTMSSLTVGEANVLRVLRSRLARNEAAREARRERAWGIFASLFQSGLHSYNEASALLAEVHELYEELAVAVAKDLPAADEGRDD